MDIVWSYDCRRRNQSIYSRSEGQSYVHIGCRSTFSMVSACIVSTLYSRLMHNCFPNISTANSYMRIKHNTVVYTRHYPKLEFSLMGPSKSAPLCDSYLQMFLSFMTLENVVSFQNNRTILNSLLILHRILVLCESSCIIMFARVIQSFTAVSLDSNWYYYYNVL